MAAEAGDVPVSEVRVETRFYIKMRVEDDWLNPTPKELRCNGSVKDGESGQVAAANAVQRLRDTCDKWLKDNA